MTELIVFEGDGEVIVGTAAKSNQLITEWFLDGNRNLDEYEVSLMDGGEGIAITNRIHADAVTTDFDVTALMPNHLREALIDKGLLTDDA